MSNTHIFSLVCILCLFNNIVWGQQREILYAPNQILVQYKTTEARLNAVHRMANLNVKVIDDIPRINIELWQTPKQSIANGRILNKVDDWIEYLKEDKDIELVQPNYIYGAGSLLPNDTAFYKQWYLENKGWNGGQNGIDIAAITAWEIRQDAKYAIVGILDTGIDWKNPDLKDNIWQNLNEDKDHDGTVLEWNGSEWVFDPGDIDGKDGYEDTPGVIHNGSQNDYKDDFIGWNFTNHNNNPMDNNGHGTHVSGIIGAKSNNNIGIAGIAGAGIQMMPLKCLDESGTGYSFGILKALEYSIANGAMITNHSYGGGAYEALIFNQINIYCKQAGQLLIAAAGNNHANNDTDPMYPASYDSDIIISVGAHDNKGNPTAFSNFGGNSVDIFAPGDAIYSTDLNGNYSFRSGTSMAAPMVTAAIALAWKQYPHLPPIMMKNRILNTGKISNKLNDLCKSNAYLNLFDALFQYDDIVFDTKNGNTFHGNVTTNDIKKQGNILWIGSRYHGLIKLDIITNEKVFYKKENSGLPCNEINGIQIDSNGDKWIATAKAMVKFNSSTLKWDTYPFLPNPNYKITCLAMEANGNKWVGTDSGGIYLFNTSNGTYQQVLYSTTVNNKYINCIIIDNNGNKWAGTNNGLFYCAANSNVGSLINLGSINKNKVYALAKDNISGNIWLGTAFGLGIQSGINTWNFTTIGGGQVIRSILIESQSNKWIGTDAGMYKLNTTNVATLSQPNNGQVRCIIIDAQNNKWVGTSNGVGKLSNNVFILYSTSNSQLVGNVKINDIEIEGNTKWIATNGEGLYNFDDIKWVNYKSNQILNDVVNCVAIDKFHNKWVGSNGGLAKLNSNGAVVQTYVSISGNNVSNIVKCIAIDNSGYKWIGTTTGLAMLDDSQSPPVWTFYKTTTSPCSLTNNTINCIEIDSNNNKWIGTDNGLNKIDINNSICIQYSNPTPPSGFNNVIKSIFIDSGNMKWIGTNDQLARLDANGTWLAPYSNAYSSNVICINNDYQNTKWLGRWLSGGLIRLSATSQWTSYNTLNSVLSCDDIQCIDIDKDANKWIGTNGVGMNIFPEPPVYFSSSNIIVCKGESLSFTNHTTNPSNFTFTWKVNGTIVSIATNLNYIFNFAGVHRVELIAHQGTLNKSFFQYITVRTPLQVNLGNDITVCHSSYVIDAGVVAEKYRWKELGTLLGVDSVHEEYYVTGVGVHTIVLEVVDYCGAADRDTISVTISSNDCVFPGDANADGSVDMKDFLVLLSLQGDTGFYRQGTPLQLIQPTYQSSNNWNVYQPAPYNTIDKKHADCNGDGTIDILTDGAVIKQNATRIMRNQGGTDSTVYTLKLKRVNYDPYQWFYPWETVWHEVILSREDGQNPTNINKLAFGVRYNLNDMEKPAYDLSNSFLSNPYGMVIRKGKNVDFGLISILSGNAPNPNGKGGKVGTKKKSVSIDTTHTTHSIFVTLTLNNATVGLGNGTNVRVHSNTSSNTETVEYRLPWTRLDLKAILQGAYDSTLQIMRTDLRSQNLVPQKHPYGDIAPFKEVEIPAGVVDWVEVQLRSANTNNPTSADIVERRAAFLMQNGTIRSPYVEDSGYLYVVAKEGDYYVVINHRNHLSVMSQTTVHISADSSQPAPYDFIINGTYNNGHVQMSGKNMLPMGDANANGIVSYNGLNSDRESILNKLDAPNDKTKVVLGYYKEDVNLDGKVKYSGEGNDRAYILRSLGGTNVNDTLQTKVPH